MIEIKCRYKNILIMKQEELKSLNSEFSEFELRHLEERLETDPLAIGGLFDLPDGDGLESCKFKCGPLEDCELTIN